VSDDYTQAGSERDQAACDAGHMIWMPFVRVNAPLPPATRNRIQLTVL